MKIDACPGDNLQTDRTCWTIQTHSDELNWARRRSFHELNLLSLLRLMKSLMFGPGLSLFMMSTPLRPITVCVSSQPLASLLDQMCFFFLFVPILFVILLFRPTHCQYCYHFKKNYFFFWPRVEGCSCVRLRTVSLFSWSVEQNARDTQKNTRVTEGARRERHEALFFLLGLPLSFFASRVSTLAHVCTPLTKSEEKERLLAVYSCVCQTFW